MFTGLIEAIGEVAEVKPTAAGFRLRLTTAIGAGAGTGRQPGREWRLPDRRLCRLGRHSRRYFARNRARQRARGPETAVRWSTSNGRSAPTRGSAATSSRGTSMPPARSKTSAAMATRAGYDRVSARPRPVYRAQRIDRRERHQPDRRGCRRSALRRADHSVYVGAHEPSGVAAGRSGEPRMRYPRQVRCSASPSSRGWRRKQRRRPARKLMAKTRPQEEARSPPSRTPFRQFATEK